ncbi:LAO/AO transport system ATPase [Salpingoeca rosetta]|uniref:LAO/AO transport system ATPase n=1 Tax=Salpingoeca rosetta (strain ATCC 50818 / BSB-021) TaxID=946362 RepID=F2UE04_SALR5|nr:LAO/AO transport system ATPase [Salpingoeca rosetta]EGD74854.1 LAO/AO transport system ATPase [Salpingoeca rosetta]|eukprot:XP_004992499.1 LAO/AO transport system ATPase [Salpingoeca rosetta]
MLSQATRVLLDGLNAGKRAALARAITLVESRNLDKFKQGQGLLSALLQQRRDGEATMFPKETIRLGISGPPGVGKSTFIEAFGTHLLKQGKRLAVLTIDPTSSLTGGSILGDKTRMPQLSADSRAFVRPSPSGGALGGVARSTSDAIVLCESVGYDVVLVETVGVGQNEVAVAGMVDLFMLLLPPAGGDELQGIKRGIMELSDLLVINKADGGLETVARQAQIEYTSALKLLRRRHQRWDPEVFAVSSLKGRGLDDVWAGVNRFYDHVGRDAVEHQRGLQYKEWMWRYVEDQLARHFKQHPPTRQKIADLEHRLMEQRITPGGAAEELLQSYFASSNFENPLNKL